MIVFIHCAHQPNRATLAHLTLSNRILTHSLIRLPLAGSEAEKCLRISVSLFSVWPTPFIHQHHFTRHDNDDNGTSDINYDMTMMTMTSQRT